MLRSEFVPTFLPVSSSVVASQHVDSSGPKYITVCAQNDEHREREREKRYRTLKLQRSKEIFYAKSK
jgi:hypothetical protein